MKQILEYNFDEESESGEISLFAFALSPEEHCQAIEEILEENGSILFIDSDSIRAKIYDADYERIRKLEKIGWSFHDVEYNSESS